MPGIEAMADMITGTLPVWIRVVAAISAVIIIAAFLVVAIGGGDPRNGGSHGDG